VFVFFFGEFEQAGDKKMGWRIQQRDFWDFFIKNRHILTKENLEVARFRQCGPVGSQN
jgi:hypothetical protein